jgi:hypothetical protein
MGLKDEEVTGGEEGWGGDGWWGVGVVVVVVVVCVCVCVYVCVCVCVCVCVVVSVSYVVVNNDDDESDDVDESGNDALQLYLWPQNYKPSSVLSWDEVEGFTVVVVYDAETTFVAMQPMHAKCTSPYSIVVLFWLNSNMSHFTKKKTRDRPYILQWFLEEYYEAVL